MAGWVGRPMRRDSWGTVISVGDGMTRPPSLHEVTGRDLWAGASRGSRRPHAGKMSLRYPGVNRLLARVLNHHASPRRNRRDGPCRDDAGPGRALRAHAA